MLCLKSVLFLHYLFFSICAHAHIMLSVLSVSKDYPIAFCFHFLKLALISFHPYRYIYRFVSKC
uniref:Putative ovule protein n=1 Tax=Solanum chacoense TaxID=4108 RepID=A0A0V0HVI5_SOLCH